MLAEPRNRTERRQRDRLLRSYRRSLKGQVTVHLSGKDPILDYDGNAFVDPSDGTQMEVRDAVWRALNLFTPQEQDLDGDFKLRCAKLTAAVFSDSEVDVSTQDAAFILERSGKINMPLVHWRLAQVLDPPAVDSAGDEKSAKK